MRPNRHSLDEDSASRLLQGAVPADDAPPGYGPVADLLAAAASVPAIDEDAGAPTITAMVEAIRASAPIPETSGRRSMIGKLFAGKALAAVAAVALTAGGAAAATGTLPTPVQGAVADAVSHIGIDLPDNHGQSKKADKAEGTDDTTSTTGKAKGRGDDDPAGDDANKGQVISGITHDPALDGQPKGPTVCAVASDGRCRAGEDHTSNSGPGSANRGQGSSNSGRHGGDDPAGDDNGDDSGTTTTSTSTTVTTSESTTSTTADDNGGSANSGSGNGGSGNGGKGSGKGRSGGSDDD
ncbi:MAG: hypothetical protein AB1679_17020 [Actinomycetota bacterium]|jgi:hypothetical protein